jgi:hypothetical protein
MASEHMSVSKQGTAGKRKQVTWIMPRVLGIIMGLESGKSQRKIMASYTIGLSAVYDINKWKD